MKNIDYKIQELIGAGWVDYTFEIPLDLAEQLYDKIVSDNTERVFKLIKIETVKTTIKQTGINVNHSD
jgi:hypothetical protein